MKASSPVVTVKIEKLAAGGRGIGHHNGKPVFVSGVLPGEEVEAEIEVYRRGVYEARCRKVLKPAPERIEPACPVFGHCGGCQWQHIAYEVQLLWKETIVRETLQRIGKIADPKVLPAVPSPKTYHWRSRVTLHGNEKGEIGFFAPNSYRVVDIDACTVANENINDQLKMLRQRGEKVRKDYELRDTTIQGFTQVNPEQNEILKKEVIRRASSLPHDTIVELFCGNGNLTHGLIPLASKIIAVDADRRAITEAGDPEHFLCTDAIRFFSRNPDWPSLDLLVLDPPRDGAGGVVEGVLKHRPKNILYVSCNPATLARDLKYLSDFAGYRLVECLPLDMFPQSHHVEVLARITI